MTYHPLVENDEERLDLASALRGAADYILETAYGPYRNTVETSEIIRAKVLAFTAFMTHLSDNMPGISFVARGDDRPMATMLAAAKELGRNVSCCVSFGGREVTRVGGRSADISSRTYGILESGLLPNRSDIAEWLRSKGVASTDAAAREAGDEWFPLLDRFFFRVSYPTKC